MKQYLTAIVFLIAVAGSSFNKVIVILDFKLNNHFIATTLCENREKPASCCHGKCYLKKKLQKDDDDSKSGSGETKAKFDINLFCESSGELFLPQAEVSAVCEISSNSIPSNFPSPVFHPPGMA